MESVNTYLNVCYGMMVTTQGQEILYRDIINKPDYYRDHEDFFNYQIFTKEKHEDMKRR